MNAQEYAAYRLTDAWKARRRDCLERHDHRCQICGCTSWRRIVDAHHLHYRNVGQELPEDLMPLCCVHHELIHNQPDGYDLKVLQRLRRECEESYWDDPLPAKTRARDLWSSKGLQELPSIIICWQCQAEVDTTSDIGACEDCGAGLQPPKRHKDDSRSDARMLGFADAKELNESPSMSSIGDIVKRRHGQ